MLQEKAPYVEVREKKKAEYEKELEAYYRNTVLVSPLVALFLLVFSYMVASLNNIWTSGDMY